MLLRHNQQQTGSLDRSLHSHHSTFTHSQPELMHHSFHRSKNFNSEINVPSTYTTCTISSIRKKSMQNGEGNVFHRMSIWRETKTCTMTEEQLEFSETCRTPCNSSLSAGEKKGSSVLPQKYFRLRSVKIAKSYCTKSKPDENTEWTVNWKTQSLAQYHKTSLKSKCFHA